MTKLPENEEFEFRYRFEQEQQARRSALSSELSHTESAPGAALPPEIPPQNFDPEASLGWGQAFQVGRTRGNVEEIEAELGGKVTKDQQGNLYWTPEGEDRSIAINPRGFDWKDLPRMVGESIGPTAGSAALAAAGGTSPLGIITRAAIGGFGGSLANEGVQMLEGTQRDPMGKIVARGVGDAALEAGAAGLGMLGAGIGNAKRAGSEYAQEQMERAIRFSQGGEGNYPAPLPADIMELTGTNVAGVPIPGQAVKGVARQADASSGVLTDLRDDRAREIARLIEGDERFILPPQGREAAEEALGRSLRRQRETLRQQARGLGVGKEAGSRRLTEGLQEAGEKARGRVSEQYEGPLRTALDKEQPVFDLGPAQQKWNAPKLSRTELVESGILDANGNPIMDRVTEQVEVIPEATGKIAYLKRVLSTLDPEQNNFEAIKRIRTEVGSLLGDKAFRDQAERPARRLYGELTEVLTNPKNAADTPRYLQEFENANMLEQWRQGMMSDDSVRTALKGKGGAGLLKSFASDPDNFVTPEFRKLMDLAPENDREMVRGAMQRAILDSPDPGATVEKMQGFTGSDSYDYLFKSRADQEAFEDTAREITRFHQSPAGKVLEQERQGYETLQYAVGQLTDPKRTEQLWNSLDDTAKEKMQLAVIDDVVSKSMSPDKKGIMRVNTRQLDGAIQDMRRNGAWSKLTEDQRERVQDMAAYYRIVVNKGSDVGTSLETASVIADLKGFLQPFDPVAFAKALGAGQTLWHNNVLAGYLANPKRANKLMRRVAKTPRNKKLWASGAIVGVPAVWETAEILLEESGL